MTMTQSQLRHFTLSHSLFPPTNIKQAINHLKFIQIDPIRSPARAQDLILRHRVKDYQLGDIDRQYTKLELEEDFLYAHGYITRDLWQLLHPRNEVTLTEFDTHVLETVSQLPEIHPRDLDQYFEKQTESNWWGGSSRSSKMALDRLHYYGLLRVVRRDKGLRIYQVMETNPSSLNLTERLAQIVLAIVHIMAPVTSKTLSQSMHRIHRHYGDTRPIIKKLLTDGLLQQQTIDRLTYLWPADSVHEKEIPQTVKFLAPFDPVVRDRFRFQHLWGWLYQFEAYVPAAKRIRGYYALPLLWQEDIIGWANAKVVNKQLDLDLGFIKSRPKDKHSKSQLDAEISQLKQFLNLANSYT